MGVLPALGSGLTDLARSGQHARLLEYDLRHYARAWDRVYYFSYFDEPLARFTTDAELGARVVVVPNRGWPRRVYALVMPLLHRRLFRECDVLRVEQFTGVVPALVARALYGVPFVVTYGYHYAAIARMAGSRMKPWLHAALRRLGLPCADGVIVTSAELEAAVTGRARRVARIPNGVDMAHFAPAASGALPGRTIAYVGRLETEKNVLRLVDVLAPMQDPPTRLVVAGEGGLRDALVARARAAGVPLDLRGVVANAELPTLLHDADVFVLPSLTEGHPKALIEAMACGKPCAASARGGIPSLIEDGVTGLLFDPEDPDDIRRALRRLLDDPSLQRRLGSAARVAVAARYDIERLLDEEVAFVRSMARDRSLAAVFERYAATVPMDDVLPAFVERRLTDVARDQPARVLDVGAGDGRFLELWRRLLPRATVIGCEISVTRARRIADRGYPIVVGQAEALPFREGAFDLVTLMEVIEHTGSPAGALDEIRRVLAPGGRLVLTTPNYPVKRWHDAKMALALRDLHRLRDDPTHISPLSASRLRPLLRARFASIALEGTAIFGEGKLPWLARLKGTRLGTALSVKLYALCVKQR